MPVIATILLAVISPTVVADATTVDGTRLRGNLLACTQEGVELLLDGSEQPRRFSRDSLLAVNLAEPKPNQIKGRVLLVDGSLLVADTVTMQDRRLTVASPDVAKPIEVPADTVDLVVLQRPDSVLAHYRALRDTRPANDLLYVVGNQPDSIDFVAGVVEGIGDQSVRFRLEGDTLDVRLGKVAGAAFYHGADRPFEPVCKVTTINGSTLLVQSLECAGQTLRAKLSSGLELEMSLASVAAIDYTTGRFTYLSDLTPLRSEWTPFIGLPEDAELARSAGTPRMDRGYSGKPIELAWPDGRSQEFAKGLAVRSRTVLTYPVPAHATRLQGHRRDRPRNKRHRTSDAHAGGRRPPAPLETNRPAEMPRW